jgi:hypothetical protein
MLRNFMEEIDQADLSERLFDLNAANRTEIFSSDDY